MILTLSYIVLFLYSIAILLIFFYSLAQFNLLLNYLKSKRNEKIIERFDIQTLNYTYNIEMAGRGIKHKVLRIFCNNSQVAVFRPTFSGWDEEIIIQIEKTISTKVVRPLSN